MHVSEEQERLPRLRGAGSRVEGWRMATKSARGHSAPHIRPLSFGKLGCSGTHPCCSLPKPASDSSTLVDWISIIAIVR